MSKKVSPEKKKVVPVKEVEIKQEEQKVEREREQAHEKGRPIVIQSRSSRHQGSLTPTNVPPKLFRFVEASVQKRAP